jgi:curli biogenesis system outer membrane secretion channel CsgG
MFKAQAFFTSKQIVLVFMLLTIISACTTQTNTTTAMPELQQLRITNSSNADIVELVVLFPVPTWDSEANRVEFGNISAGQTSEYQNVPSGVYRYAAYEYTLNGHVVRQPVIDWVGESPMAGKIFTYQIALDLKKVEGDQITLVAVLVDEP